MSLKDIFGSASNSASESRSPTFYGAVIDTSNYTLVALGTYAPALFFLTETILDTEYVPRITLTDGLRLALRSGPRSYPEWSWSNSAWAFKKTNAVIVTNELRDRAVFATQKVHAISKVIGMINRLRSKTDTGLLFQDTIYLEKKRQAHLLKDARYDERLVRSVPYVAQYAEYADIPLRQAAEEILLQAELDDEYLARSEKIRLALFKRIKFATTSQELEDIIKTYRDNGTV